MFRLGWIIDDPHSRKEYHLSGKKYNISGKPDSWFPDLTYLVPGNILNKTKIKSLDFKIKTDRLSSLTETTLNPEHDLGITYKQNTAP